MLPHMMARVVMEQCLKDEKYRARIVTRKDSSTSSLPNSTGFSIGRDRWPG
jgi:hypothetical protein